MFRLIEHIPALQAMLAPRCDDNEQRGGKQYRPIPEIDECDNEEGNEEQRQGDRHLEGGREAKVGRRRDDDSVRTGTNRSSLDWSRLCFLEYESVGPDADHLTRPDLGDFVYNTTVDGQGRCLTGIVGVRDKLDDVSELVEPNVDLERKHRRGGVESGPGAGRRGAELMAAGSKVDHVTRREAGLVSQPKARFLVSVSVAHVNGRYRVPGVRSAG